MVNQQVGWIIRDLMRETGCHQPHCAIASRGATERGRDMTRYGTLWLKANQYKRYGWNPTPLSDDIEQIPFVIRHSG